MGSFRAGGQITMVKPIPVLIFAATVSLVLVAISAITSGTTQHVLIVVAIPVLVALGAPLALGRVHRREDRPVAHAHHGRA